MGPGFFIFFQTTTRTLAPFAGDAGAGDQVIEYDDLDEKDIEDILFLMVITGLID